MKKSFSLAFCAFVFTTNPLFAMEDEKNTPNVLVIKPFNLYVTKEQQYFREILIGLLKPSAQAGKNIYSLVKDITYQNYKTHDVSTLDIETITEYTQLLKNRKQVFSDMLRVRCMYLEQGLMLTDFKDERLIEAANDFKNFVERLQDEQRVMNEEPSEYKQELMTMNNDFNRSVYAWKAFVLKKEIKNDMLTTFQLARKNGIKELAAECRPSF